MCDDILVAKSVQDMFAAQGDGIALPLFGAGLAQAIQVGDRLAYGLSVSHGVQRVGLWVTDGHQAMRNALQLKFPSTLRQRCIKHKLDNVLGYLPDNQRDQVLPELKAIFYQANRQTADQAVAAFIQKYADVHPTAVACLQRDLEACLTFYAFPESHWKTIRTTNVIEHLFSEVKRRSHKMATVFRNESSCLLMFYAVVRSLKFRRITMPTN